MIDLFKIIVRGSLSAALLATFFFHPRSLRNGAICLRKQERGLLSLWPATFSAFKTLYR
jgi:hypothetical protein